VNAPESKNPIKFCRLNSSLQPVEKKVVKRSKIFRNTVSKKHWKSSKSSGICVDRTSFLQRSSVDSTELLWCVVGGCYTLISVVLVHQCLLGLLVSAPSLLCEGRGFEPPIGRGKITLCCKYSALIITDFSAFPFFSTYCIFLFFGPCRDFPMKRSLRIVSYTVLVSNYPVSNQLLALRFLLKNRSVLNAMIRLIGNGQLPCKDLLY
jgi:hypothetical protein